MENSKLKELQAKINQYFRSILAHHDPLDYFSQYIAPALYGCDHAKKAILLSLATQEDYGKRRRVHVLLYGPPGTGKTELLLWLKYNMGAVYVSQHTSAVGLVGDARFETEGALEEANGGILCIDELDKFSVRDQEALLEAMEEGEYTIRKGNVRKTVEAEVRVIAAANDIRKISKPLLDRFDIIVKMDIPPKELRLKALETIVDGFVNEKKYSVKVFKRYLQWIKDFEPSINKEEVIEVLSDFIRQYDVSTYSYRSLELSILRIAYAYAKLCRSNIGAKHIIKAIEIKFGREFKWSGMKK